MALRVQTYHCYDIRFKDMQVLNVQNTKTRHAQVWNFAVPVLRYVGCSNVVRAMYICIYVVVQIGIQPYPKSV